MKHIGTKNIETDRLILRRFKIEDAKDMFNNWGSDPNVTKFLSWNTHTTIKNSEDIVNLWVDKYDDEKTYNWAIELKEIGQAIGNISVVKLYEDSYACEIGYCIGSEFWNKGITTEAFNAVIDFLFSEVGFNRIMALHDTENGASGQVMKKCNMVHEGVLRECSKREDEFYSLAVYSILKKEWEESNSN